MHFLLPWKHLRMLDPSHRGVSPPVPVSDDAAFTPSRCGPAMLSARAYLQSLSWKETSQPSEVDVTFLSTEAFVDLVACFCRSHCSSKEAVKVEVVLAKPTAMIGRYFFREPIRERLFDGDTFAYRFMSRTSTV